MSRKVKQIGRILGELCDSGTISTDDPSAMTESDCRKVIEYIKGKKNDRDPSKTISIDTAKKMKNLLREITEFYGANYWCRIKIKFAAPQAEVEILDYNQLKKVFDRIDHIKDYRGMVLRGAIYLAYETAARASEIRTLRVQDVDLDGKQVYIRNPKGKGVWANPSWTPMVFDNSIRYVRRFLDEREMYLRTNGVESDILFVHCFDGKATELTQQTLQRYVHDLSEELGFHFTLQTIRSTVASLLLGLDCTMERLIDVSEILRHRDIKTTMRFYIRLQKRDLAKRVRSFSGKVDVNVGRGLNR